MIGPQSPASPIFISAHAVSAADVAAEGFSAIATIEANHIVVAHALANRDSRSKCFFAKRLPSKLTEASMNDRDEIRKLTCSEFMVSQVTPNDFRNEWPMTVFGVHGSLPGTIFCCVL
jgi:hypothetical protein